MAAFSPHISSTKRLSVPGWNCGLDCWHRLSAFVTGCACLEVASRLMSSTLTRLPNTNATSVAVALKVGYQAPPPLFGRGHCRVNPLVVSVTTSVCLALGHPPSTILVPVGVVTGTNVCAPAYT